MNLFTVDTRSSQPLMLDVAFKPTLHLYSTGGLESQPIFIDLPATFPDACAVLALNPDGTSQLTLGADKSIVIDVPEDAVRALLLEFLASVTISIPEDGRATIVCEAPALKIVEEKDFAEALLSLSPDAVAFLRLGSDVSAIIGLSADAAAVLNIPTDGAVSVDVGDCEE